jgi:type I restriction enzyme R subunit
LRNPTCYELVERIEQLIEDYNAGSVNIDEYLRHLIELSKTLTAEEERETDKASAKKLLEHLHEKLVQDWRRKVATTNDVNSTIRRVLDQSLPETPYTVDIFHAKVQCVFDHVLTAYGDNGESAYDPRPDFQFPQNLTVELAGPLDVN